MRCPYLARHQGVALIDQNQNSRSLLDVGYWVMRSFQDGVKSSAWRDLAAEAQSSLAALESEDGE